MSANYLFNGEEVALMVRPHPVVLIKPALGPFAGIALLAATPNRFTFVIFLIVLARFSWDAALWWSDRYVVTTDRIISMSGIITKKIVSLPLPKITDLTYSRSVLGRVFGYGSLDLESAGQRDFGRIDFLPDPDHFYRAIMALALGMRPGGEPPEDPGKDPDEVIHLDAEHSDRIYNTAEIPIIRRSDD